MVNIHVLNIRYLELHFVVKVFIYSFLYSFFEENIVDCFDGIVPSILYVNDIPDKLGDFVVLV